MITNKDLIKCNEQLFSYSAAYQVPFYGREEAVSEMQQLSKAQDNGEGSHHRHDTQETTDSLSA